MIRWLRGNVWLRSDALISVLIFVGTLLIFLASPMRQMIDSNYAMLVSQSLLERGTFALDHYALPRHAPHNQNGWVANGDIYQLEIVRDQLYYYFPPGTSVLSVPYVALMNRLGVSVVNADGTRNPSAELRIQGGLAALLMAALAGIFFFTARLVLPLRWSILIALAGVLGTQVWSTASRVMWADTWAILLLGMSLLMLSAQDVMVAADKRRANPVLLASLLAWTYFVRPTNSIAIAAITAYILIFDRKMFIPYAMTGAAWFAGFIAYSWSHFGQVLPSYYLARALEFDSFWTALAGNLISPSRGLLVYVPVLLFVAYLLVRYWDYVTHRRLVLLSLIVIAGHLIVTSGFSPWHGGGCYGPRYTTGLVPWFVLLGIIGVQAMLKGRPADDKATSAGYSWHVLLTSGAVLLSLSVLMNARGAISYETWRWNAVPVNVDVKPSRIWDWRRPQFLAGLVNPPLPEYFPVVEERIDFPKRESNKYLWYGWSGPEAEFRWTDGNEATVIFALNEINDTLLELRLEPFIVPGKLNKQTIGIELNRQHLETLTLSERGAVNYSVVMPKNILERDNVLSFRLPNAAAPIVMEVGDDYRRLGINVLWMRLRPQTEASR